MAFRWRKKKKEKKGKKQINKNYSSGRGKNQSPGTLFAGMDLWALPASVIVLNKKKYIRLFPRTIKLIKAHVKALVKNLKLISLDFFQINKSYK